MYFPCSSARYLRHPHLWHRPTSFRTPMWPVNLRGYLSLLHSMNRNRVHRWPLPTLSDSYLLRQYYFSLFMNPTLRCECLQYYFKYKECNRESLPNHVEIRPRIYRSGFQHAECEDLELILLIFSISDHVNLVNHLIAYTIVDQRLCNYSEFCVNSIWN